MDDFAGSAPAACQVRCSGDRERPGHQAGEHQVPQPSRHFRNHLLQPDIQDARTVLRLHSQVQASHPDVRLAQFHTFQLCRRWPGSSFAQGKHHVPAHRRHFPRGNFLYAVVNARIHTHVPCNFPEQRFYTEQVHLRPQNLWWYTTARSLTTHIFNDEVQCLWWWGAVSVMMRCSVCDDEVQCLWWWGAVSLMMRCSVCDDEVQCLWFTMSMYKRRSKNLQRFSKIAIHVCV